MAILLGFHVENHVASRYATDDATTKAGSGTVNAVSSVTGTGNVKRNASVTIHGVSDLPTGAGGAIHAVSATTGTGGLLKHGNITINAVSHVTASATAHYHGNISMNALSTTTGKASVTHPAVAIIQATSRIIGYRFLAFIGATSGLAAFGYVSNFVWEWLESGGVKKGGVTVFQERPHADGSYGQTFLFDDNTPFEEVPLIAKAVPYYIYNDQRNQMLTQNTEIFVLVDNSTVTGIPTAVSAKRIRGSNLYDLTVQVKRTDVNFPFPELQQGGG